MPTSPTTDQALRAENAELRARLEEAEEMLRAIRAGEVDALVVEGDAGPQLFTLQGLDAVQNRLRGEMLAQVSDAVIATDLEERVTFLNAAAERQYGVRASDVLGRGFAEIYTRQWGAPDAEAGMWTALGERGEWRGELIHRTHEGREMHVEKVITTLRGPDGTATGYVAAIRDIRERKQAETALRLTNERLTLAVKCSQVVLFQQDLELRYTWIQNPSPGFDGSDVIGKRDADLMERAADAVVTEGVKREVLRTGLGLRQEVLVQIQGVDRHYDLLVEALRDAAGLISGVTCAAIDITERKRAEETVARLAAIVESSHDALFSEDLDGIVTSWNRGAEQIFGYRADEIIGTSIMRLIPAAGQEAEHEMQRNIAAGERGGTFEAIRTAKDGRKFHASITLSPLKDAAGNIVGTSRVVRDITERKAAEAELRANEERMRLATTATEVGIWEWNVLTGRIRWDAQMFQLYGVVPTADGFVSYDTWSRAVMPEDLPRQEEVLMDTVRRIGQSTREFRILRADDGECRWIQAVETVRANEQGKAEWVVGTNLDVTERKNAERTIREEAQRKDEFLAMLGHELRNPLNAIRHAVQISGETPKDTEACQWAAKVIDRQSQQLSRMVDDLLDVGRINRGRIELRPEALDVAAVLERAIAVVRPLLAQRRHTLTQEIGMPLRVTGDAARLEQVFVNLLNNAAKYTPEGGAISVRAHNEDGEAVVTITDSGVGIPPELLPHVFDLFRQADSTLDRAMGGLGIGLSVVKSLVEMHLGRVTVESAGAHAGTTVTVRLPLLLDLPAAERPPAPPALDDAPPKALRVLVVDDHEDAAQALARLLKRRGCEVRCAYSGPDGVAAAREFLPEALLLDLGLPGFDGYEVARILRADPAFADALVIAISGYAQDGDRQRCLASGFDDHFAKPLDIPKLVEAIHARCLAGSDPAEVAQAGG